MEFTNQILENNILKLSLKGKLLTNDEVSDILSKIEGDILNNHILLDLSQLTYISSAGLSLFIRLLTRTRIQDKKVVLVNLQENVYKLFQIAKLNDIFAITDSVENAIKNINLK